MVAEVSGNLSRNIEKLKVLSCLVVPVINYGDV